MQYRRKSFYTAEKKQQLKNYILASVFPTTGNPRILDTAGILAQLRTIQAFNDLKVSELMVLQALEELRASGELLEDSDGWGA